MSEDIPDLWPDEFGRGDITPPLAILRRQAMSLGKKTEGRIEGEISTKNHEGRFSHSFYLVAPSLDNYSYRLLHVSHDLTMYPLDLHADPLDKTFRLDSEDKFLAQLQAVFSAAETKRVIQAILAQVEAVPS